MSPDLYPPSWADRLSDKVANLPVPAPLVYIGLWAILFIIGVLITWWGDGAFPTEPNDLIFYAAFSGEFSYAFGLFYYLRRTGASALRAFWPVYQGSETGADETPADRLVAFQTWTHRLTNVPVRPGWAASLTAVLIVSSLMATGAAPFQRLGVANSLAAYVLNVTLTLALWSMIGVGLLLTVRMLVLVNRLYTRNARVSVFGLRPLYAFSGLSARIALAAIIGPSVFYALVPGVLSGWSSLALALLAAAGAAFAFAWPLLGIHGRLTEEKGRLMDENALRLEYALTGLHQQIDDREIAGIESTNVVIGGLRQERAILNDIPTWPWQPGILRAVITALLLPLIIWLAQYGLELLLKR